MSDLPPGWTAEPVERIPERGAQSALTLGQLPSGWTAEPLPPRSTDAGSILPISKDEQGNPQFDTNAGILGMVKRAVSAPGEVYRGELPVFGRDTTWNPAMISRASELAELASPVNPAFRAGDLAIPGVTKATMAPQPGMVRVPTAPELKAAGSAGYDAVHGAGLDLSGDAIVDLARGMQSNLISQHGIIPESAPQTYSLLDRLTRQPQDGFVTLDSLKAARQGLGKVIEGGGTEGFAAQKVKNRIDDFLGALSPADTRTGSQYGIDELAAIAKTFRDANANYAASQRSNQLTGALDRATTGISERAQNRAQATNSGMNIDNAIRQRMASMLEKPGEVAGYSGPEIGMLSDVLSGGPVRNAARRVGNLLGGGGGIAQSLLSALAGVLGGSAAGSPGMAIGLVAPPIAGHLAKTLANTLARRSLNQADEFVRTRSPLYEEQLQSPPMTRPWLPR